MDDISRLRELSDNPELYLEDEDREILQSNLKLLDVSMANSMSTVRIYRRRWLICRK